MRKFRFSLAHSLGLGYFLAMVLSYRYRHNRKAKIFYFLIIYIFYVMMENSVCFKMCRRIMNPRSAAEREAQYFTNTWAVRIVGGLRKAEIIAKRLGFDFQTKVSQFKRV